MFEQHCFDVSLRTLNRYFPAGKNSLLYKYFCKILLDTYIPFILFIATPVNKNLLKVSKIMLEQSLFGRCENVIFLTLNSFFSTEAPLNKNLFKVNIITDRCPIVVFVTLYMFLPAGKYYRRTHFCEQKLSWMSKFTKFLV